MIILFLEVLGFFAFLYLLVTTYLAFYGSNYLPTRPKNIRVALSLVKPGDIFIDLGFGNGEVLEAALNKGVLIAIGYEVDFVRFIYTAWKLRQYLGHRRCVLYYRPIWNADLTHADVVYTFFTSYHIDALYRKAHQEMKHGSTFISYVHPVLNVTPFSQQNNMYVYHF